LSGKVDLFNCLSNRHSVVDQKHTGHRLARRDPGMGERRNRFTIVTQDYESFE
jgi:hypothetical protein